MVKLKRSFKKSINKKSRGKSVAAAVIAGTMFITLIGTDAGAEVVEGIKKIGTDIATSLGITKDINKYVQGVGVQKTVGDITFKINEAILNNDKLIITSTIRYKSPIKEDDRIVYFNKIFVNDNELPENSIGGAGTKFSYSEDGYVRTETTEFSLAGKLTQKDNKFKIQYTDYRVLRSGETTDEDLLKGNILELELNVNGEALANDTREIILNKEIKINNETVATLGSLTFNNVDTIIKYTFPKSDKLVCIDLKGSDDKGNKITLIGDTSSDGLGELSLNREDGMPSEDATKLILTPTIKYISETGELLSSKTGEEFTIDLIK